MHKVVDGNGFVHPTRKRQYISLITNIIEKYIFNINKDNKINKNFNSCIPHRSKIEYFLYAINNCDI